MQVVQKEHVLVCVDPAVRVEHMEPCEVRSVHDLYDIYIAPPLSVLLPWKQLAARRAEGLETSLHAHCRCVVGAARAPTFRPEMYGGWAQGNPRAQQPEYVHPPWTAGADADIVQHVWHHLHTSTGAAVGVLGALRIEAMAVPHGLARRWNVADVVRGLVAGSMQQPCTFVLCAHLCAAFIGSIVPRHAKQSILSSSGTAHSARVFGPKEVLGRCLAAP